MVDDISNVDYQRSEPCATVEERVASLGDRSAQPRIAPPSDSATPAGEATT